MLVSSRRKTAPALRLESLEERLVMTGVVFAFEPHNLTIRVFGDTSRTDFNTPSTPSAQSTGFSLNGFQGLILDDLIDSLSFAARTSVPDATQSLASSSTPTASQSGGGTSAATRGNGSILTNVAASAEIANSASQLINAFELLRALPQNFANASLPVNTFIPLSTASTSNGDSALAGLAGSLPGPKRLELGHIYLGDLKEEPDDCTPPEMKRLPDPGAKPLQPMVEPEKPAPAKGSGIDMPATPETKPELPATPTQPGKETEAASLSLTWVDPTETQETQPVFEGTESLRSYAATLTVALVINGWWNPPATQLTDERERRRMALRRWPI